jgi:hypothetical protein
MVWKFGSLSLWRKKLERCDVGQKCWRKYWFLKDVKRQGSNFQNLLYLFGLIKKNLLHKSPVKWERHSESENLPQKDTLKDKHRYMELIDRTNFVEINVKNIILVKTAEDSLLPRSFVRTVTKYYIDLFWSFLQQWGSIWRNIGHPTTKYRDPCTAFIAKLMHNIYAYF